LIALNGFFVAVEFSTVSVPHTRIDQLAARGSSAAALLQKMLRDTDRVLAASQLGITMASLGLGWLGENLAGQIVSPIVAALPAPFNSALLYSLGFALAFAVITSLHIVLGEQAPKMTAIQYSDRFALFAARPVTAFGAVFRPFIAFLDHTTEAVLSLVHVQPVGAHKIVYTADELKQIVAESQRAGEIEPGERILIQNVFDFGDRQVYELMIPRTDIVAVEDTATIGEFLKTFAGSSHGRYPVYSNNLDNVVGYVSIKDVLHEMIRDPGARERPLKGLMRAALFVPESKRVNELLAEMQKTNRHLAIVIDEYGGTFGMATTENLLEEIVGGIGDERVTPPPPVNKIDERTSRVQAHLRVDEVNELLGTDLPEADDYETLAGLILARMGRIPKEGDSIEVGEIKLTVAGMNGPRIEQVIVTKPNSHPQ
jgi:CBS domain containing-hemolysin-like protein